MDKGLCDPYGAFEGLSPSECLVKRRFQPLKAASEAWFQDPYLVTEDPYGGEDQEADPEAKSLRAAVSLGA